MIIEDSRIFRHKNKGPSVKDLLLCIELGIQLFVYLELVPTILKECD